MASGATDYWASSSNKMSAMLDSILAGLFTGAELLTALEAIDVPGIVTAIETVNQTVEDLDALDGVLDGKLDLSDLKEALTGEAEDSIFGQLKASVTQLTASLTKLDTSIDRLTNIELYTHPKTQSVQHDWSIPDSTEYTKLAGLNPARLNMRLIGWLVNDYGIGIYTQAEGESLVYLDALEAGDTIDSDSTDNFWARTTEHGAQAMTTMEAG